MLLVLKLIKPDNKVVVKCLISIRRPLIQWSVSLENPIYIFPGIS